MLKVAISHWLALAVFDLVVVSSKWKPIKPSRIDHLELQAQVLHGDVSAGIRVGDSFEENVEANVLGGGKVGLDDMPEIDQK